VLNQYNDKGRDCRVHRNLMKVIISKSKTRAAGSGFFFTLYLKPSFRR
jgi:hypothetical protein